MADRAPLRVGVLGYGAIGQVVAEALADGEVRGARLSGVVSHTAIADARMRQRDFADVLDGSDLIVEAAGQQAIRDHAVQILAAGVDLVVVSVGAMADEELSIKVTEAGPGQIFFTAGAIGGLDLLSAARRFAPFRRVRLVTTKLPATLAQPWMDASALCRLRTATEPFEVYRGTAREVPSKFPKSTNVAAGLALATGTWDGVEVIVRADPSARTTSHVIDAEGPHGSYHFEIRNAPDESNPATSKVVPHAVLRTVATLARTGGQIV